MSLLRHQVLTEYKKIFRAIIKATPGDLHGTRTLHEQSRVKFRENRAETDTVEIEKHIQLAKDVELVITKHLAQFVEVEENKFKSNFRPELEWMDDANRPAGAPAAGPGCQLPPVIEPRRKRKRIPLKKKQH